MSAAFYASPSGGGTGLSAGSPTTFEGAQTLALANGGGCTIWLAGGVYYGTSTFQFTVAAAGNDVTYRALTGQVPIFSGAKVFAGGWTNTSGSTWTATIASSVPVVQVFVNGQRAVVPHALVPGGTSNTWTLTPTGVVVDAATAAALATWTEPAADGYIEFLTGGFYYARAPMTAITGNTVTLNAAILQAFQSLGTVFSYTIDHASCWAYSGSATLCANPGDFHRNGTTGLTTYIARGTDSMGASPLVEVATLDTVAQIGGTLGAPGVGITLIGLTFEATGDASIYANGFSYTGGGVTGTFSNGGVNWPQNTGYDYTNFGVVMEYATGCNIFGCTVRRMASNGLGVLRGAQGCRIEGLTIEDVLGTGFAVGPGDVSAATETDSRKLCSGNVFRRSSVSQCGTQTGGVLAAFGVVVAYASGCTFDHLSVTDTAIVGIGPEGPAVLGGPGIKGGNVFTGCRVSAWSHTFEQAGDVGAYHSSGDNNPASEYIECVAEMFSAYTSGVAFYLDLRTGHMNVTSCVADQGAASNAYVRYSNESPVNDCHDLTVSGMYSGANGIADGDPTLLPNVVEIGTTLATPLGPTAAAIVTASGM